MRKKLILLSALLGMSVLPLCSCDVFKNDKPPVVENGENEQIVFILGKDTLNYTTVDTINEKKILDNYTAYDDKGKVVVPLTASVESYDSLSLNFKTEGKYEVNLIFTFGGNKTIKKHITINITKGYNGITKDLTKYQYLGTTKRNCCFGIYVCEETMDEITLVSQFDLEQKTKRIFNEKTNTMYVLKEQSVSSIPVEIKSFFKLAQTNDGFVPTFLDRMYVPKSSQNLNSSYDYENFYYYDDYIKEDANPKEFTTSKELGALDLSKNPNIDLTEGLPEGTYPVKNEKGVFINTNIDFQIVTNDKGEELVIPFPEITHKDQSKNFYFLYNKEKYYYANKTVSIPAILALKAKDNKLMFTLVFKGVEKQKVLDTMGDKNNILNYVETSLQNGVETFETNFDFVHLANSKIIDIADLEIDQIEEGVIDFNAKPTI